LVEVDLQLLDGFKVLLDAVAGIEFVALLGSRPLGLK
jgi:hypothetical protein